MKVCAFVVFVLALFVVSEELKPIPLKKDLTTLSPMKGLVFWKDRGKSTFTDYGDCISLEFIYLLPYCVVTGKQNGAIQYNWSSFEKDLNEIASRKHQAVVRVRYSDPGSTLPGRTIKGETAVPQYIKDLSDYKETYSEESGHPCYYPDWSHSELMWFHKQFFKDLAKRYDNDPRFAFLQVGFGHWAEYHIYPLELKLGKNFPTKDFQKEFFKHLNNVFVETPFSAGISTGSTKYSPFSNKTDPEALAIGFGLFDDSLMYNLHEKGDCSDCGYNEGLLISLNYDTRLLLHPMGGEISYNKGDQQNFLNPKGLYYGHTWEYFATKYMITYTFANDCLSGSYATPERVLEAGMHAGYSLRILSFRANNKKAEVVVMNEGVASVYHNMFVTVNGVRSKQSLKHLFPGENITCYVEGFSLINGTEYELTITSDKLLEDVTVPYAAGISSSSTIILSLFALFSLLFFTFIL